VEARGDGQGGVVASYAIWSDREKKHPEYGRCEQIFSASNDAQAYAQFRHFRRLNPRLKHGLKLRAWPSGRVVEAALKRVA
jgi:hypothetical protein